MARRLYGTSLLRWEVEFKGEEEYSSVRVFGIAASAMFDRRSLIR